MRFFRGVLVVLLALSGITTRAAAQFQYDIAQFQQVYRPFAGGYVGGFTATVHYQNVNAYGDPSIISFNTFNARVSQRVKDFCNTYSLAFDSCDIAAGDGSPSSPYGLFGNVQTGNIPLAGSFWVYSSGISEDSCTAYCSNRSYFLSTPFGVLGCQAPAPTPDFYSGRTCDSDGYDGALSIILHFYYQALDPAIPQFAFVPSDLTLSATDRVWNGPNAFVQLTPEPGTWILTATGLALVMGAVRRRRSA